MSYILFLVEKATTQNSLLNRQMQQELSVRNMMDSYKEAKHNNKKTISGLGHNAVPHNHSERKQKESYGRKISQINQVQQTHEESNELVFILVSRIFIEL
jgi:hypothetical protein